MDAKAMIRGFKALLQWPNLITLSRALAALAFLFDSQLARLLAVAWAIISDALDGWLARKLHLDQSLGAILDPIVDKFFMFSALMVLLMEHKMSSYEILALFSRDIILAVFGLFLALTGHWKSWQLRAPRLGKLFTALQFILLFCICLDLPFPHFAYSLLITLGLLLFVELCLSLRPTPKGPLPKGPSTHSSHPNL